MSIFGILGTIAATLGLVGTLVYVFLRAEIRNERQERETGRSHHDTAYGKDTDVTEPAVDAALHFGGGQD